MARLFTCADVLEQLEDSNGDVSSGDDSAYEGEGIVGYRYQLYARRCLGLRICMTWT